VKNCCRSFDSDAVESPMKQQRVKMFNGFESQESTRKDGTGYHGRTGIPPTVQPDETDEKSLTAQVICG
jgi:hypothetical protein